MDAAKNNRVDSVFGRAIRAAYWSGQEDETLQPLVKVDEAEVPLGRFSSGDAVVFYDVRGEREVEITESLTAPGFRHFPVVSGLDLDFVTLIEYDPRLRVRVAFPKDGQIRNTLTEVVTGAGFGVAKIAESEKATHIGFFMNGKSDMVFRGEERTIVPSPQNIANYDETPEMSAAAVADEIVRALAQPHSRLVLANLANVDVVGHIEKKEAVLKAIETVDRELGRVVAEAERRGVTLIVTADHGTVEEWLYPDGAVNTGHTKNPVPFVLADFGGPEPGGLRLRPEGELADVAPTILNLLGLATPPEMTGSSLLAGLGRGSETRGKVLVLILDGWGIRPADAGNLIAEARTPNFDAFWDRFPRALLQASGPAVGMPPGTVGNSEAGHLHIGAGRRIPLDRVRIDNAIADGSFFANSVFLEAMAGAKRRGRAFHLMGIVSHYSSHGTIRHLFALLQMAKQAGLPKVYLHAFLGRRGEKPESGAIYIEKVEDKCRELGVGEVVTVLGRYWSLDREENWARIEKAYRALVQGDGHPVGNFFPRNS
jgi:2,3-bisphosphoglycerate-independent phosphoglycerate mutase